VARPNSTESPNIPARPNQHPSTTDIESVVEHYEHLMQRLLAGHAPEFAELDITMTQAKVLYVVVAAGRLGMSGLASRLNIGMSSASELVERLVELGLLRRGDDPDDRRHVVVTATPEAHALLERFRELNQHQLRGLLARLRADELACVDESLVILQRAIDRPVAEPAATSGAPDHTPQENHS